MVLSCWKSSPSKADSIRGLLPELGRAPMLSLNAHSMPSRPGQVLGVTRPVRRQQLTMRIDAAGANGNPTTPVPGSAQHDPILTLGGSSLFSRADRYLGTNLGQPLAPARPIPSTRASTGSCAAPSSRAGRGLPGKIPGSREPAHQRIPCRGNRKAGGLQGEGC